jgi:hypothetical protein
MISLALQSSVIQAPSHQVFGFVTNMENYKDWFPGIIDICSDNDLDHGTVGKKYRERLLMPNGESELLITVEESIKNKKFLTQGDLEAVLPQMTIVFTELTPQDCKIDLQFHSRNQNLNESDELTLALQSDLKTRSHTALATLKRIMEDK